MGAESALSLRTADDNRLPLPGPLEVVAGGQGVGVVGAQHPLRVGEDCLV